MFLPNYEISTRLLNSLIKVEVDLNVLKNIEVASEWQFRLKREALTKRLVSSLRFEGVEVSSDLASKILIDEPGRDEETSEVATRLGITVRENELQKILNWLNGQKLVDQIVYLSTKFRQNEIGEKELIQLNRLVGERLVRFEDLGSWRTDTFVENSLLNHPKAHEVPYQFEDLLNWNRSATTETIHPILRSVVLVCELLRIRPFLHNNLQTVMFFCHLILGASGYDLAYCSVEEEWYKSKQRLFEIMAHVDESGKGVEELMDYMVGGMAVACEKAKLRVLSATGESVKYKTTSGRAVALTERQVALMEELTIKNQLTIKELRQVLPLVSDDTILRDLKDLVEKKMIRKRGKTKGAVYVLGKVKSFR